MSLYNADELQPPEWLNKDFLQKVLNYYKKCTDIMVLDFHISPATMKGDHYGSVMFRTKINYKAQQQQNQHMSLIVKTVPMKEGKKRDLLVQSPLFRTEIDMYTKALPKMQQVLADCGEPTKFAADLIYETLEPHPIIVLEDLCQSDYKVIRGRSLQEAEVKAVYGKVAKLHAVSYMLSHTGGHEVVTQFRNGIMSSSAIVEHAVIRNGITHFINLLTEHKEFGKYLPIVTEMEKDLFKQCQNLYKAYELGLDKDAIYVLNHGDFHIKNLMFKYYDDNPNQLEDVIMVDYQLSCFAPSNIDLVYSQYLMLNPELPEQHSQYVEHYFEEFSRTLRTTLKYKGKMPLLKDFQQTSLKYRHFTLFLVSTFLPWFISIIKKSAAALKDVDVVEFFENTDRMAASYWEPQYLQVLGKIMPFLLKAGYLEK